ncbi:MAG: FHA domain-containing protein [Archangium sp.]|nr:FHA domain-containing protein [Archangium sp.]
MTMVMDEGREPSKTEFQIAPHLERALDAMSKDLSIEPQALVNQAVFAWLRINGYVAPSAAAVAHAEALAPTVEKKVPAVTGEMSAFVPSRPESGETKKSERALEAVPTEPVAAPPAEEKKKSEPALAPVVAEKKKSEPALAPVAPPAPEKKKSEPALASVVVSPSAQSVPAVPDAPAPAPVSSPSGGQLAAMARMKEIAADLEKLTKPWPDWVAREEEEEDEEEEEQADEPSDQDDADQEDDQDESDSEADDDQARDEREETGDHSAGASTSDEVEKPEPRDPFEADLPPEVSTGENEVQHEPPPDEEPVGESTVVLRSVPIVLYLEREGADPVRVDNERFIIGRGPTCDLVIDSPRVSREHVAITRQGIRYFLKDLNSSNGTWIGEDRIGEKELESGDVISLGNEPITFILRGE